MGRKSVTGTTKSAKTAVEKKVKKEKKAKPSRLTNEEKEDAIAYFQSLWSDEFYNLWLEGGGLKKKSER